MTDLVLGAHLTNGAFPAHAWVERAGQVLDDTPDVRTRFAPLSSMSSATGS